MSGRRNVSILSGTSLNNASSYLKSNELTNVTQQTNVQEFDLNTVVYNNIYNNYLRYFLRGQYTVIDEEQGLINTITTLARTVNQIISVILLDSLSVVQRGLLLYKENTALKQQIASLQEQLEDCTMTKPRFGSALIETSVNVDVSLDLKYLFYVKEYGPPLEGLFDSRKLAEVIQKYGLYEDA